MQRDTSNRPGKGSAAEDTIAKYHALFDSSSFGINTDIATSLWQTMALSHLIAQDLERLLTDSQLRAADMRVLAVILIEEAGAISPSQIARILSVTPAAVTLRLKHLEEHALIVRRSDRQDHRKSHMILTDTGRSVIIDYLAKAGSQSAFARAIACLSDDDREQFEQTLSRLNQEMERYIKIG